MTSENQQPPDSDMGIFDDPSFNSNTYDSYSNIDSPFDASRFFNLGPDSPDYNPRTPSKSFLDQDPASAPQTLQQHPRSLISSRSAESSSQDSSSESSVRRKRKTTSESPPTENFAGLKMDPDMRHAVNAVDMYGRPTGMMSMGQDLVGDNMDMNTAFDFDSAASSPGVMNPSIAPFHAHHALKNNMLQAGAPAGTIEPAQFFMGSTGASPTSAGTTTGDGSPAVFPDTGMPSGPPDMFTKANMWGATGQHSNWSNDFGDNYASPGNLGLTPSPVAHTRTPAIQRTVKSENDLIPLHIGAIPAKSRVETQINIRMTIDRLPPGVSNLHLPTHTIAKAKLLNKDVPNPEATLELHTMLVCTSAMNNEKNREHALKKAAMHDNREIQARGMAGSGKADKKEEEDEEMADDDKPSNGGEVRICQNCINRERKRAARKKLKKEEEQAHWERYETERVIVFNTNEYKAWLDWQQSPPPKDGTISPAPTDLYAPTDTAMQISAPMRIACYCRHHNEKDGFQVIFTLKDWTGKVVAQAVSDSILITDDHKTHPMSAVTGHVWYDGQFPPQNGFSSQSMIDLPSHANHMPISKSTGNLSSLRQGSFQGSSMHQLPAGFNSQTTSGSMTPRNLSRPASPTGLSQAGPAKKRKSSSVHRRVPSALTMTKVDTNQSNGGNGNAPFSPTSAPALTPESSASYLNLSNTRSRQSFPSNQPPTPSDGTQFFRNLSRTTSLDQQGFQAFYSTPNSAHQSRANSPTLHGPNLAAMQRQQGRPNNQYGMNSQAASITSQASNEDGKMPPIINKVVPAEGPTSGGIEVSIYGQNFTPGMEVMFGDRAATATTYWGEKALCCVLPPAAMTGGVPVTISGHIRGHAGHALGAAFKYTPDNHDMRMMEMALRFYSLKMTGTEDNWQSTAQNAANMWLTAAQTQDGGGAQSMPGAFPGS